MSYPNIKNLKNEIKKLMAIEWECWDVETEQCRAYEKVLNIIEDMK